MKKQILILTIIFLIPLLLFSQNTKVIGRNKCHFREGPGSYYPLIGMLKKGSAITILNQQPGWVNIKFSDKEGWISKNALKSQKEEKIDPLMSSPFGEIPSMISRASASGAIKGFAQKFIKYQAGSKFTFDQYQSQFITPDEYHRFKQETYQERNSRRIRNRYKKFQKNYEECEIFLNLEKLGLAVAAQIASNGKGLDNNITKLKYLNLVGTLVLENSELYDYPVKFYILNDSRPTAYASPNGIVFISKGFLNILENEAELACVLGHEIAHIVCKHGYQELSKRKTMIIAEGAFDKLEEETSNRSDPTDQELEEMAINIYEYCTAPRQIEYEYEADKLGMIYAYRAGYEPTSFVKVLNKININSSNNYDISHWEQQYIKERIQKSKGFVKNKLNKHPKWNVEKTNRFRGYF